jgi:hypothetical protein
MKTTRDRKTIRALIEQGSAKDHRQGKAAPPFRLRKVTFKGEGLDPELRDGNWDKICDLAYEGRGGDRV